MIRYFFLLSTPQSQIPFFYNPEYWSITRIIGVKVYFWDDEIATIYPGFVQINDPFLHQLLVKPYREPFEPAQPATRFVSYDMLRSYIFVPRTDEESVGQPWIRECAESVDDDESVAENPDPASAVLAPPSKKPKIQKSEEPEVDMGSLIECDENEVVPLTYVPCVNGILKKGSTAVFCDQAWTVTSLQFDGRRKKAFACLASVNDEVSFLNTVVSRRNLSTSLF